MAPAIYATIDDVRPLLGNLRTQLSNEQIQLAIDSASAEVNLKTARPINQNADTTDPQLNILKRATRYLAAEEVLGGIEDMRDDRRDYNNRARQLLEELITLDISGEDDIVTSSEYVTFPANETNGLIYSSKFKGLRGRKSLANRFVPLDSMD